MGGVDWWYHNRGHYDIQMMREMSDRAPVLYVNSIGMRVPRIGEGRIFASRIARKLRSVGRGLTPVRHYFSVFSPFTAPGRIAAPVRRLLPGQVRRAMRRVRISQPLLWIACPPAAGLIDRVPHAGLVYQRTDRYEAFTGVDPRQVMEWDRTLKARADVTVFCSRSLYEAEAPFCRAAAYVDHGVDFELFLSAGEARQDPPDVATIRHPRIGFVGGIDSHTFDPALFLAVVKRCPELEFVLVGGCSLSDGWCDLPNVHLLGRREYSEVAAYMAACDVLIMPWNSSEWIRACNPVKLKEYLAVGRPVVSTPFDELAAYGNLVRTAADPDSFSRAIRDALANPHDPRPGRDRVQSETWSGKARTVIDLLALSGVRLASSASLRQ